MSQEPNFPVTMPTRSTASSFRRRGRCGAALCAFRTPLSPSGPGPTPSSAARRTVRILALISGVHPAEYPAIEANIRVTRASTRRGCAVPSSRCR